MAVDAVDSLTLHKLTHFAREVAGSAGVKIVKSLGDGATDDRIGQRTNLEIPVIRSTLNRLHNYGIVEYTREKNTESGWYTYTWKLNPNRALRKFLFLKKHEYAELLKKVSAADAAVIYECKKGCVKLSFDAALERKFSCPRCKKLLKWSGGEKELEEIEEKIRTIEKIIGSTVKT